MEVAGRGSTAVLAEKPSVARDIARTLGATQAGEAYLHGNGFVVTCAIGHLVALPGHIRLIPLGSSGGEKLCPRCHKAGHL